MEELTMLASPIDVQALERCLAFRFHALLPQHVEGLSIARRQLQGAQLGHGQLGRAQGAFEDASANHGLEIGGDSLSEGPKPRGRANKVVGGCASRDVSRLGSPQKSKNPCVNRGLHLSGGERDCSRSTQRNPTDLNVGKF